MDDDRAGEFSTADCPERALIRQAVMEVVVEQGYEEARLELVLERGGLERGAFERHFSSLAECCARIYAANVAEFDRVVFGAAGMERNWRDQLRAAAYAAARHVRDRPLETRFDMIAMLQAGDLTQAYRDRYVARIVDLIDQGRYETGDPASVPRETAIAVFGAIYEFLQRSLQRGRSLGSAVDLVPELMYIAVRAYLGQDAAAEELTVPPPPEGRNEPIHPRRARAQTQDDEAVA
jgi:AcrR family transcriptional regulator